MCPKASNHVGRGIYVALTDSTSVVGRVISTLVMASIVLSIVVFCLDSTQESRLRRLHDEAIPEFDIPEMVCILVFTVEFVLRLATVVWDESALSDEEMDEEDFVYDWEDRQAALREKLAAKKGRPSDAAATSTGAPRCPPRVCAAWCASGRGCFRCCRSQDPNPGVSATPSAKPLLEITPVADSRRTLAAPALIDVLGGGESPAAGVDASASPPRTAADAVALGMPSRARRRMRRFWRDPMNWIDLLSILPFYIELGAGSVGSGGGLAALRVLRLARVLRVFKLGRRSAGMQLVGRALTRSLDALAFMLFFVLLGIVLFGSLVFFAESGSYDERSGLWLRDNVDGTQKEPTPFVSIPASFWWVVVTATTVGYGDFYPTSVFGKIVGGVAVLAGVVVLALPITIIGANFTQEYAKIIGEQMEAQAQAQFEEEEERKRAALEEGDDGEEEYDDAADGDEDEFDDEEEDAFVEGEDEEGEHRRHLLLPHHSAPAPHHPGHVAGLGPRSPPVARTSLTSGPGSAPYIRDATDQLLGDFVDAHVVEEGEEASPHPAGASPRGRYFFGSDFSVGSAAPESFGGSGGALGGMSASGDGSGGGGSGGGSGSGGQAGVGGVADPFHGFAGRTRPWDRMYGLHAIPEDTFSLYGEEEEDHRSSVSSFRGSRRRMTAATADDATGAGRSGAGATPSERERDRERDSSTVARSLVSEGSNAHSNPSIHTETMSVGASPRMRLRSQSQDQSATKPALTPTTPGGEEAGGSPSARALLARSLSNLPDVIPVQDDDAGEDDEGEEGDGDGDGAGSTSERRTQRSAATQKSDGIASEMDDHEDRRGGARSARSITEERPSASQPGSSSSGFSGDAGGLLVRELRAFSTGSAHTLDRLPREGSRGTIATVGASTVPLDEDADSRRDATATGTLSNLPSVPSDSSLRRPPPSPHGPGGSPTAVAAGTVSPAFVRAIVQDLREQRQQIAHLTRAIERLEGVLRRVARSGDDETASPAGPTARKGSLPAVREVPGERGEPTRTRSGSNSNSASATTLFKSLPRTASGSARTATAAAAAAASASTSASSTTPGGGSLDRTGSSASMSRKTSMRVERERERERERGRARNHEAGAEEERSPSRTRKASPGRPA